MLYYEIKLIHPETKEIFFSVTATRPKFPPKDLIDRHRGAIIVIKTTPSPKPD